MAYQVNKPAAPDELQQSQIDIQQNFLTANTVMSVNHYPFDNVSGAQGKHKFVEMPGTSLPGGLSSGEGTLYTRTLPGVTQLFYTPDLSAQEYQLTRCIPASAATFGTFTVYDGTETDQKGGWTFLPGGLILVYGQSKVTGAGTTVTFPITFTNVPYSIENNLNSRNHSYGYDLATTTGYKFISDASTTVGTPFFFTVIGK